MNIISACSFNRRGKSKAGQKLTRNADHHNPESDLLKCDMCDFMTSNQEIYKIHFEGHNECNKCDFVGGNRMELRNHILARHREKGRFMTQYTT